MTTKDMLQILIKGQDVLVEKYDSLSKVQNALIKGQDALVEKYDSLSKGQDSLKGELAILREEMRDGFKGTHERLDKQGKQLAYLEEDAPTREEHDQLTKRVEKIEKVLST
ncbi:hypothetical protein HZA75_02930 [Candidatus Roizmanbacteria bacterium]|nr:hypothetical protein [Candidatus Roizmanbacteria bacterium]